MKRKQNLLYLKHTFGKVSKKTTKEIAYKYIPVLDDEYLKVVYMPLNRRSFRVAMRIEAINRRKTANDKKKQERIEAIRSKKREKRETKPSFLKKQREDMLKLQEASKLL